LLRATAGSCGNPLTEKIRLTFEAAA